MKCLFQKNYNYNSKRYSDTFLANDVRPLCEIKNVNEVVYCFWTGDNPMSENRSRCYKTMLDAIQVNVKLITYKNIDQYILAEHPLHQAFDSLSLVHKSDYLRCYFMHFYGGGYSDIKTHYNSWGENFQKFNNSSAWIMGYREVGKHGVAVIDGVIGKDLKKNWQYVIGNGSYICRPQTPFTSEWYNELQRRMDGYSDRLVANPGNVMGDNEGYPIPWTNILGDIFHPLCLKYHEHIVFNDNIKPDFSAYR